MELSPLLMPENSFEGHNKKCFPPNQLSRVHWAQRLKWQEWSLYRSVPGCLCICYGCSISILVGILTVGMPVSLILLTALETLSFIGLPWSTSIGGILPCLIVSCFVLIGRYLLEACTFLKGNGGRVDLGER